MDIRSQKVGDGLDCWTYGPCDSGRQKDGSSCGVFVCMVRYKLLLPALGVLLFCPSFFLPFLIPSSHLYLL